MISVPVLVSRKARFIDNTNRLPDVLICVPDQIAIACRTAAPWSLLYVASKPAILLHGEAGCWIVLKLC